MSIMNHNEKGTLGSGNTSHEKDGSSSDEELQKERTIHLLSSNTDPSLSLLSDRPRHPKTSPQLAACLLIVNATSSVALVYVNKVVLNQFPLPLTLTFFHQIVIWGLTTMLTRGKELPEVDIWSVLALAGGAASVIREKYRMVAKDDRSEAADAPVSSS